MWQLNFVTNSQILPELASDLDEHLALAPTVEFIPQLSIGEIGIANCSRNIFELHSAVRILSLTFVTDQILGIERKLNSILTDQKMDSHNKLSVLKKHSGRSY